MPDLGRYRLVIFDCDGTLVDSQHNIIAAMTTAWRDAGLPAPDPAAVRRQVGLTLEIAVARMLPEAAPDQVQKLADSYRRIVNGLRSGVGLDEPLFDGVRDLIDALSVPEIFLGVATGKNYRGLEHTLATHGLRERFHTLQTGDRCRSKPDPEMVLKAAEETGVSPWDSVVIGDTSFDMEMARAAGATAIGVGWGYHPPEELMAAGAQAVIDAPRQLIDCLQSLSARR